MLSKKEIIKIFIEWIRVKIKLHFSDVNKDVYFREGQIWWTNIGQNVGVEINGKNHNFERPALVLKKFNEQSLWILPITSVIKNGKYYYNFINNGEDNYVNISQLRSISSKRLIRKLGNISQFEFDSLRDKVRNII